MDKLLYGAAYYLEYLPCDRLAKDMEMMKKAGINTIRIAESTWSTEEPQDGVFDFSYVDRVLDAAKENDIQVIIGTPTYAVPTWMVKAHPDVLISRADGSRARYGARQIMDITHPVYRYYAERIIRKLISHVADHPQVIGYQLDNETKYYDNFSENVQCAFIKYLRNEFHDDLDALNDAFGLAYWSNRINAWEDFPDVRTTINGSLGCEFEKFSRTLVDEFLAWQAGIVSEYKREDQFLTHNFDFDWQPGYSYGLQPSVNHFHAAKPLTIAGCDIYHPSQNSLTGAEIAFGGDLTRSLKNDNYLVIETEAQGHLSWLPFPGQLRLQAFSHLASGANSVLYWHWSSIHNSFETYWKGLLSHDFAENATYLEACTIGADFARLSSHLVNLKKENHAAIMVSNEALSALKWFKPETGMLHGNSITYNNILRWCYDQLYRLNVECDFITPETADLGRYDLILAPALYAVPSDTLQRLDEYVSDGGHLVVTFKSAVADEYVKVYHDTQPHILHQCLGISYNEFTHPDSTSYLVSDHFDLPTQNCRVLSFMELVKPDSAEVLASYQGPNHGQYAAVTRNSYGKGSATYIGCMTDDVYLARILEDCVQDAGLLGPAQKLSGRVIIRSGKNDAGHTVMYYLNYSAESVTVPYIGENGTELLHDRPIGTGEAITLEPWGFRILESR